MCISLPGEIIGFHPEHPHLAQVLVEGQTHTINIGMLEDEGVAPGEWVLIQAGMALAKIDADEAKAALDFVKALNQSFEDEMAIFANPKADEPAW